ncbi:MAG: hypothetical protein QOJ11_3251 [Frankiales bacterium]|jgi:hypothetical protein|nr:hypothetical protein [Frankiales bacterium]
MAHEETPLTAEHTRLAEADAGTSAWRRFGPYVAERAWGTVREDYSAGGDAWDNLTHDEARSMAYRWNEDGMAALCDEEQYLCLGLALWNGVDPILKERMFGLTNSEGNHGEDVKEQWWYADATPTSSWLSWRYHYPRLAFPYEDLLVSNEERGRLVPEYEIADTGALDGCWVVTLDVAKAAPDDLRLSYRVTNTGAEEATIHVLPQAWFRNTWSWAEGHRRPVLSLTPEGGIAVQHGVLGSLVLTSSGSPDALFCDNDTNTHRLYGTPGPAFPKDGINDHVVSGAPTVNPQRTGTKAAFWHVLTVEPGATAEVRVRLAPDAEKDGLGTGFDEVHALRKAEADAYYAAVLRGLAAEHLPIARQAFAGLLWGKCFYHYNVQVWLDGDPAQVDPPPGRGQIRNGSWRHLDNRDVISMPDPWEYPWYAAWDLAFHTVALAHIDPAFAKSQLLLLCREWYMHPSGQLPAYEWNFSDVNPPVQAWAALRVFEIDGSRDFDFLERVFHKLTINFTWWVNRVDTEGNNVFEGGFLGLDNVGPFDRSKQPPVAGHLEQTDGTAWMAMYCLDLLGIALTLAAQDKTYEDVATKFFEHFTYIAIAMNGMGDGGLWDETDGFYYDVLRCADGSALPMRVRSVVGLVPVAAVAVISDEVLKGLPDFTSRLHWFLDHKPDVAAQVARIHTVGSVDQHLFSVLSPERLVRVLEAVLDEAEFLSPYGIRSLSRRHVTPYVADLGSGVHADPVSYEPGESTTGLFGGNSNWRGPVWFPLNRLVIGGLRRFGDYLGDDVRVELPRGSGRRVTLSEAAADLSGRLVALFVADVSGKVPAAGDDAWPNGLLWFHEYFHGDTGKGLGASHQTGWTSLVVDLLLHQRP